MRQIINRGPADIELHMLRIERFKPPLCPRCAVMQEKLGHVSAACCDFKAQRRAVPPDQWQDGADIRAVIFAGERKP